MPIKFRPKEAGKKSLLFGIKERLKDLPFEKENPYLKNKKPKIVELSFSEVMDQRMFAVYSLRRVTNVVGRGSDRLSRNIDRISKDRLKHGLVSEEAVNRLKETKRKQLEGKIQKKIQTTVGQDIKNIGNSVKDTVVNSPQMTKEAVKKVGTGLTNIYENTGQVVGDIAKATVNNPSLVVGEGVVAPAGRVVVTLAPIPASAKAGYQLSPVGPGTVVAVTGKQIRDTVAPPHKVVKIRLSNGEEKMVTRNIARHRRANKAKRIIGGDWSIKEGVDSIKSGAKSLLEPIDHNYTPSYTLRRITA